MLNLSAAHGMRTSLRYFVFLLSVILLPTLTGCGGALKSEGSVALLDDAGTPYSFAGATATLFRLNSAAVIPGQSRTNVGAGIVAADGSAVTLSARAWAIRDTRWYAVEFRCPTAAPDDDCEVDAPLHVVLNGAQVRAGGWQATALTEAAFHEVAYAVAAGYFVADVQKVLDNAAATLLVSDSAADNVVGNTADYADLLAWNPADTAAVLRASHLIQFSAALAAGADSNAIKVLVQQWITPLVGSLTLNDSATDVALAGQFAYVLDSNADEEGTLQVVDVSNPSQPELVGSLGEMGDMSALQVVGDRAYVVERENFQSDTQGALHIVDLGDPQQPNRLGRLDMPGRVTDVVIAGDYAVITQGTYWDSAFRGLQIIDISNPQTPVAVGSMPVETGLTGLAVVDNLVYAVGPGGLYQIDISNPALPTLVHSQIFYGAVTIAIAGNYAYTSGQTSGEDYEYSYDDANVIRAIDLSNPSWPVVGSVHSAGNSTTLTLLNDRLYASSAGFLEVIDVSNPALLRQLGQLSAGSPGHWIQPDGLAYVAAGSAGLHVYDTRIVDRPPLLAGQLLVDGGVSDNAAVGNGYAYTHIRERGLKVFDLSNPVAPQFLRLYPGWDDEYYESFALAGQYAYVTDSEGEAFKVLDISNPAAIRNVAGIWFSSNFSYEVHDVAVVGGHAYVSYGYNDYEQGDIHYGGLFVLDIQNPSSPQILATYQNAPKADALAVSGDYAFLALTSGIVEVIDVSDPQAPVAVATLAPPGPIESLTVSGNTLYVSAGVLGVHLVDITEPTTPTLLTTLDTPGFASAIIFMDGYAYVADGFSGVQVVAIGNPAAPVLVGAADTLGVARGLFPSDGWLYASTSYGYEVIKPLPAPVPAP